MDWDIIKNVCVTLNSNTTLLTAAETTNLKDKAAPMSITLPDTTNATVTRPHPGRTTAILVRGLRHNMTDADVTIIAAAPIPAHAAQKTTRGLMREKPNAAHLVTTVKTVLREAPLILDPMWGHLNAEAATVVQTPATAAPSLSAVLQTTTRFA